MGGWYRLQKRGGAFILGACIAVLVAAPATAQTAAPTAVPGDSSSPPPAHEGTIIGGNPPSPSTLERCVDVEIGGANAFSCLNQRLKRDVERTNPSFNMPPLDARSPDVRVGNANEAAIREQYGSNYGRSAVPYRPPPQIYVPPPPHH